jgi:spermidine synthase
MERIPIIAVLFFGSGVSALIYQTLWLRMLALVFGVTVYAASTVLASFMTGLALGSLLASRIAHRITKPLVWFGAAEVAVGAAALATPELFEVTREAYVAVHPKLPQHLALVTLTRFLIAFAVLIVPTVLMGATLPLVMKSSLTRPDLLGTRISMLYAMNTAGAIAGAILAGFYLVPFAGLQGSFQFAAALNALVGAIAIGVGSVRMRLRPAATAHPEADTSASGASLTRSNVIGADTFEPTHPHALSPLSPRTRWIVLGVFALSGVASLALEVLWFRVLVIFLRPTTYAFTIMLGNVLAGIAIGSAVIAPLMKRRLDWLAVLAMMELTLAVVVLSSFTAIGWSLDLSAWLAPVGFVKESRTLSYLLPLMLAGLLAIFPASLLLGAAFPVGLRLWSADSFSRKRGDEAGRVGRFYAVNVCGALIGSIAAGFLLIPKLGSQASLIALSGVSLMSGLVLMLAIAPKRRAFAIAASAIAVTAFGLGAARVPNPFDLALARLHPGERLLWREEGVQTTVAVHRAGRQQIMYLDGHHQANDTNGTTFVHHRIGWLPAALHPAPKRALVIGLGGGATPGAIARFPGIDVDVVELSPTVVEGARWFSRINFDILNKPNARLRVDDGRNFLLLSKPRQYDIITADVMLPHHAGAGNLYSADYFRLVRRALKNDGIVLQWIGSHTREEYLLQLRTFLSVFPETTLWGDGSLMVGSKRTFTLSHAAHQAKLADPGTRSALEVFTVAPFERLVGQYIAGPKELLKLAGEGPVLTDDQPRVEYFLSLPADDKAMDLSGLKGHPDEIVRP